MGTKNRIFLGVITSIILHHIRNIFKDSKDIYITKRKYNLIKTKHPDIIHYIDDKNFQIILDNTVATCKYKKDESIYNFISKVDNRYILYSLSSNNYYTHISTVFYTRTRELKVCKDSIVFFNKKEKEAFEKLFN